MTSVQERPDTYQPRVAANEQPAPPDPRRWKALAVLCVIQFMLTVDVTVTNVALPRIKEDLGFSEVGLGWVVNGYVIIAGGLLLLGGRLSDLYGRRRLFMFGVALFGLASVMCGSAWTPGVLVGGRFAQGMGEAMAQPAALGLIAILFTNPAERVKAIGMWGGVAGLAGVTGVVGSGLLTDLASWRWIFFVNVPVTLLGLLLLPRLVSDPPTASSQRSLDLPGAATLVGGILAITFGLTQVADHSWGSSRVMLPLGLGVLLMAALVLIESRTRSPLIPLRFFRDRTRVTAYLSGLMFSSCFVSFFFLMTLYLQQVQHTSPMRTGLYYSPLGVSMVVGIGLATGAMGRLGVKRVLAAGFFIAAVALMLGTRLSPDTDYVSGVLPMLILLGIGAGVVMPAGTTAALHAVTEEDSGLGSGTHTTVHQIGAALGVAGLGVLALNHANKSMQDGVAAPLAATNGYAFAFGVGSVVLIACGVLVLAFMEGFGAAAASSSEHGGPVQQGKHAARSEPRRRHKAVHLASRKAFRHKPTRVR